MVLKQTEDDVPLHYHVLNAPNLNLLGECEPEIYGDCTGADLERSYRWCSDTRTTPTAIGVSSLRIQGYGVPLQFLPGHVQRKG